MDSMNTTHKLKAIVDPEGDIGALTLSDIIDVETLRSMMEDFYQLTGMLGAVLDISGKVLVAVGWQDICTKFHRFHPDTLRNCTESDTILTEGVPPGTFKAYHCKNNMWDMVTPLMIGGRHVGNVFIGQFFYEDETPDVELFRQQARQYGFDEAEYLAALDRVPRFSREAVDAGMRFYSKLAGLISTMSFSAIQKSRMLAERKRAEDALRESEGRYRALITHMDAGIVVHASDTSIVMNNPRAAELLGLSDEQMKGKEAIDPSWKFVDEKNIPLRLEEYPVNKVLSGRKPILNQILGIHRPVINDIVWVVVNGFPMFDRTGGLSEIVISIIDITEHKQSEEKVLQLLAEAIDSRRTLLSVVEDQHRAEEKIRTLNDELEQRVIARTAQLEDANKELEAFSYSVSHDLRAPLRAIDGFSHALQEDLGDQLDETCQDHLKRVRAASQRMAHLIDDLLKLSRLGRMPMDRQRVDLSALVQKIAGEFQAVESSRHVEVLVAENIQTEGDPSLIAVVIENLLGNAWKFTSKTSLPRIEFGRVVGSRPSAGVTPSAASGQAARNGPVFFVRDNGAGFDMQHAKKLFGAFQRLHSTAEFAGTGIGLATVARIIHRHGGEVWAEGAVGQGATFYFTLESGALPINSTESSTQEEKQ